MNFSLQKSIEVLERTPGVLTAMLSGLPDEWIKSNEGPGTWSPYDVVAHYIHCEITDWVPRMDIILSDGPDKKFKPFDPSGHDGNKGKSLTDLLKEFSDLRKKNVNYLRSKQLTGNDLRKTGIHPKFGEVTLAQLLSTWTAHDLNHIAQVSRVMAKQYKEDVGPWIEFLRVLK